MAVRTIRRQPIRAEEQYTAVNDTKLQLTLATLADRYSEQIRAIIYATYQDDSLAMIYRRIRNSGVYAKGSASKVHRKILEFPNAHVYDFCDTVMTELYGPDWLDDRRALRHELIKPWWVVSNI